MKPQFIIISLFALIILLVFINVKKRNEEKEALKNHQEALKKRNNALYIAELIKSITNYKKF